LFVLCEPETVKPAKAVPKHPEAKIAKTNRNGKHFSKKTLKFFPKRLRAFFKKLKSFSYKTQEFIMKILRTF
jgi:hypothetical protein